MRQYVEKEILEKVLNTTRKTSNKHLTEKQNYVDRKNRDTNNYVVWQFSEKLLSKWISFMDQMMEDGYGKFKEKTQQWEEWSTTRMKTFGPKEEDQWIQGITIQWETIEQVNN